jgi:hypothetical protein
MNSFGNFKFLVEKNGSHSEMRISGCDRYTEELRKIHGPEVENLMLVPFNIDASYVADGGTPYGRYVKISIVFR